MKNIKKEYIGTGIDRKEIKSLTSLDCRFCYFHINVLYIFNTKLDIEKIKKSLLNVLQYFPEMEGRLKGNASTTLKSDCCGKGILFVTQNENRDIEEIKAEEYEELVENLDFAKTILGDESVFSVKITEFKNEKTTVGITVNHSVTDACGMFNFIKSWADVYNGKEITKPNLNRVMLEKYPGEKIFDSSDKIPEKAEGFMCIGEDETEEHFKQYKELKKESIANKVLKFEKSELENMKKETEKDKVIGEWVSTNDVLSAHIWKILSEVYGKRERESAKLLMVSNLRGGADCILPKEFFGNGVAHIITEDIEENIQKDSIGKTALKIRKNINKHNREKVKEQMLWLKNRLGMVVFAEFDPFAGDVSISSFYKFPVYSIEFGNTRAVKALLPPVYCPGVVRIMPDKDGGAEVYLSLYREDMEKLEKKEITDKIHKYKI